MTFSDLGLSAGLCSAVARLGYREPTPVQEAAIPAVLGGADLLAQAQTGTGKTAAFGLPMIERLERHPRRSGRTGSPRGLVLVPTRELAVQVRDALSQYGASADLYTLAIYGGVSMEKQVRALQRRADLVVATPGRLLDHLARRTIDLSAVEILTVDEADRMLDLGFRPPLRRIVAVLPRDRQTLLFSATLPPAVASLAREMTRTPKYIDMSPVQLVAPSVSHQVHPVADDRKRDLLTFVLTRPPGGQALVFCRTKRGSDRVGRHLDQAGIASSVIHGNKSQNARTRALEGFRTGRVKVLVATDVAARGLDIAQLPLVVNYDLPLVASDYIHRVGRTGRAGRPGRAISFASSADRAMLRDIERLLPAPLERVVVGAFGNPDVVAPAEPVRRSLGPRTHTDRHPRVTRRFSNGRR